MCAKTLIIDLDGSFTAFDSVQPFLYPLLQNGSIYILAASGSKEQRQETVGRMFEWLQIQSGQQMWQIIFLSSAAQVRERQMNFVGCLADRLEQVKKEFLDPLTEIADINPFRVLLLDLDPLAKDALGIPIEWGAKEQWHLDIRGYVDIGNNSSPVFSVDDIESIASEWIGPLDLGGQRLDNGLSGLGDKFRKPMEDSFVNAKKGMSKLVETKKKCIEQITDGDSRFLDVDRLDILQNDFFSSLDVRLAAENIEWMAKDENPFSIILIALLRKTYSALSVGDRDVVCIRFPNGDWLGEQQGVSRPRRGILRLAYFLIFLSEQGENCRLDTEKMWTVNNVDFDQELLNNCIAKTKNVWMAHANQIEDISRESASITCQLSIKPCDSSIQLQNVEKVQGSLLSSQEEWQSWVQTKKHTLDTLGADAEQCLDLHRKRLQQEEGQEKRQIDNIVGAVADLEKQVGSVREELRKKAFRPILHDWPDCICEISRKITDILATRLSFLQKILMYITALCVLLIPYYLLACQNGSLSCLKDLRVFFPFIGQVGFVVLIDLSLTAYRNIKIMHLQKGAREVFQQQGKVLKEICLDNSIYLQRICQLSVLVGNLRVMKGEMQKVEDKLKKLAFFKRQFKMHCSWLSRFTSSAMPDNEIGQEGNNPLKGVNVDVPPAGQELFVLAVTNQEYNWIVDGASNRDSSRYLPGLLTINLISESGEV